MCWWDRRIKGTTIQKMAALKESPVATGTAKPTLYSKISASDSPRLIDVSLCMYTINSPFAKATQHSTGTTTPNPNCLASEMRWKFFNMRINLAFMVRTAVVDKTLASDSKRYAFD